MSQHEAIRAESPDVERQPPGAPMQRIRGRLVRRRASDARIVRLARRIALRRAKAASAPGPHPASGPAPWRQASAVAAPGPRLDAVVIGRHCRQAFPLALADGEFGDLLAMIEQAERDGARSPSIVVTLGAPVAES